MLRGLAGPAAAAGRRPGQKLKYTYVMYVIICNIYVMYGSYCSMFTVRTIMIFSQNQNQNKFFIDY